MSDRHRPPAGDLPAKQRDHAAAASQYISEAHAPRGDAFFPGRRLHEHLAEPLGRAHYVCGIDGLVGGDEHESRNAGFSARVQHILRSAHIVNDCLARMLFHQRDVFVRRRMKHDLRPKFTKNGPEPVGVAYIGNDRLDQAAQFHRADLLLQFVDGIFVFIQERHSRRLQPDQLAHQLASDGTSPASYEHALSRVRRSGNLLEVGYFDALTAQHPGIKVKFFS